MGRLRRRAVAPRRAHRASRRDGVRHRKKTFDRRRSGVRPNRGYWEWSSTIMD
jgi:hypothetical protein